MSLEPFLDSLNQHVLVCDGAMGTMLYAKGIYINQCFDELNLSNFGLVKQVHLEYIQAGADVIETNTFGANRLKLAPFGFEKKVREINYEGAKIARAVAQNRVYVAGAIGPLGKPIEPFGNITIGEARDLFREQAQALADGGVDLFILETFGDLYEIHQAILGVRDVCDKPIVAQMIFKEDATTLLGVEPEHAATTLERFGADVIGANCGVGPQAVLDAVLRMAKVSQKKLAVQPNAGDPRLIDGRVIYMSSPEYHSTYAKRFLRAGVSLIGGCCGTTPDHIKAIKATVKALRPTRDVTLVLIDNKPNVQELPPIPTAEKTDLAHKMAKGKFVVSVELLPPRGVSMTTMIERSRRLYESGVDAINIPDGPRASARMTPMAAALLVKQQVKIETILHYCCRDRNLLGMQSDLLGLQALGLHNILAITGDPPKMGDYPDATAVFDIDAIGLVRMIDRLNHGLDVAGNSIGEAARFFIGVGANPAAIDIDIEIERFHRKAAAGAEYALTQPVYKVDYLQRFLERTKATNLPILVGICPLVSHKNAEFLHNEVPGMSIPDDIRERMRIAGSGESGRAEGIKIAQEALLAAKEMVQGAYITIPMGKLDMALEVLDVL